MQTYTTIRLGPAQADALRTAIPEYIADFNPQGPRLDADDKRLIAALDRLYKRLIGEK